MLKSASCMASKMLSFKVRVEVWLKEGLVDAEGKTVEEALNDLGYRVSSSRVGKVYEFVIKAGDEEEAKRLVNEMCTRLLANPVKDKFIYEVKKIGVQ